MKAACSFVSVGEEGRARERISRSALEGERVLRCVMNGLSCSVSFGLGVEKGEETYSPLIRSQSGGLW